MTGTKSPEEYDTLQAMIIKNESQLLPHRVDPFTVLTEVTRENNVIILNHQVTGLPPELFREENNYFSDGTRVMQINIKPSDCGV